jgi:hypothetical protein
LTPPSQLLAASATLPRSASSLLDEVVSRSLQLIPDARYPDRHAWLDAMSGLRFEFQRLERSATTVSIFTLVTDLLLGRFRRPPP